MQLANGRRHRVEWLIDALVHDPAVLNHVVDLMGASRVAMGTDYPFPLGELVPGELINSMPYDPGTKEMLLGGAALQWLAMERGRFA